MRVWHLYDYCYAAIFLILHCKAISHHGSWPEDGPSPLHRPMVRREQVRERVHALSGLHAMNPVVQNAGFDDGEATDVSCQLSVCGPSAWTVGGAVETINKTKSGKYWSPQATSGDYLLAMTNSSGAWVEQALAVTPGESYTVSFDVGKQADAHEACLAVLVDGQLQKELCAKPARFEWERMNVTFQAAGSTATIRFVNNQTAMLFIDTIAVESTTVLLWAESISAFGRRSGSTHDEALLRRPLKPPMNVDGIPLDQYNSEYTLDTVSPSWLQGMPWFSFSRAGETVIDPETGRYVPMEDNNGFDSNGVRKISITVQKTSRVFLACQGSQARTNNGGLDVENASWTSGAEDIELMMKEQKPLKIDWKDIECDGVNCHLEVSLKPGRKFNCGIMLWPLQ